MTILSFYTLQTAQYFKWRILIIEYIKASAPTIFTLKRIFIWSWFETIYAHFLIIFAKALMLDKICSKWDLLVAIFIHYKVINLGSITDENNKKHNEKCPYILDYPYRNIIVGGSGSGKTNALINWINEQNDIDKVYLYARDLSQPKYGYLI